MKNEDQVFCDRDKHEWEYDELRWNRWCIWCGFHQFSRPLGYGLIDWEDGLIDWEDGVCHRKGVIRKKPA